MTIQTMISTLANGFVQTVMIFVLTLIGSMPLGLLVTFGRMSKITPIRLFVKAYISVMRGTPLMLQLMVVFFAPHFLFHVSTSGSYRLIAVLVGFIINYAAYFSEIYRGGIEAIPYGQHEAAQVLGYSKSRTFLTIIFPQVFKQILPSITNEMITLVKDTSLAFAISYMEMFSWAKKIASSQSTITPFLVAGVFYYIFNLVVATVMERCEKGLSYYR